MSTILNTLKKLEEEKSVLEKNIDLKGLLLQGQESVYPQAGEGASRKWGAIGGLIIGGVLLGGLIVYFSNSPKTATLETKKTFVLNQPSSTAVVKKPLTQAKSYPGFSLARIPENPPDVVTDPLEYDDFLGPEDALTLPLEPPPPAIVEPEPVGSEAIREIESLIQTATESSEMEAESFDEIPFIAPNSALTIPGLKVKGIIFLNQDNPVNHIYVSTPDEKNRKLKVGDDLLNATLESIEAQKAIFSYQGQRVEKTIGE